MKKTVSQSEVDVILTNEKIMARLHQEKNHLKRLIQENRLLEYRILAIDHEYCAHTGSGVHEAYYSGGILTDKYLKGLRAFRIKVGALKPYGGFSKAYVVDIPIERLNQ